MIDKETKGLDWYIKNRCQEEINITSKTEMMDVLDDLLAQTIEHKKKHPNAYEMYIMVDGVAKRYTSEDLKTDLEKLKTNK